MITTKWESFVNRLKSEASKVLHNNRSSGVCIVTARVAMTADGDIIVWVVHEGVRIEPSKDALRIVSLLVGD